MEIVKVIVLVKYYLFIFIVIGDNVRHTNNDPNFNTDYPVVTHTNNGHTSYNNDNNTKQTDNTNTYKSKYPVNLTFPTNTTSFNTYNNKIGDVNPTKSYCSNLNNRNSNNDYFCN